MNSVAGADEARAVAESLEDRMLLSVTWANMATPDGTNKIYEGGIEFELVLTGQTSSGLPTLWNISFGDGAQMNNVEGPGDGSSAATIYHAYSNTDEEGDDHSVTAQVTELSGSNSVYPVTAILETVDAPLTPQGSYDFVATQSVTWTGVVADFLDMDPEGTVGDYLATIDWGDGGAQGTGTVQSDGAGGFTVSASHAFATAGIFQVTVQIDDHGASTNVTDNATVLPVMEVPTINHNQPNGQLSQSDKTGSGVWMPLNNDDWDYDGTTDISDTGAVQGDQFLLPITLPKLPGAQNGDGYELSSASGVGVYLGANRSNPYGGSILPATADQKVYVEARAENTQPGGGPSTIYEAVTYKGKRYTNVDKVNINIFALTGALDVPGGGTYDYNADDTAGQWAAPDGGALAGTTNQSGQGYLDAQIKWTNVGEVGYALFQANPNYNWGLGVNVVGITLQSSSYTYGGPPTQITGSTVVGSIPSGGIPAMTLSATLSVSGPMINGVSRGVKFMNIGIVQDGRFTKMNAVYNSGQGVKSTLQDGLYHIDYLTSPQRSTPPWYDSDPVDGGIWSTATDPTGAKTITLSINDTPQLMGTPWWTYYFSNLSTENIHFDLLDYVVAATTVAVNGSQNVYDAVAQGSWYFDGSGYFTGQTWTGFSWAKDDGDTTLSSNVTIAPITTGMPCNDLLSGQQFVAE